MLLHPAWRTVLRRQAPLVKLLDVREDITNLTTYTFSGCSLGELGSVASIADTFGTNPHLRSAGKKAIVVVVHGEDTASAFSPTSVTIGGVAGTLWVTSSGAALATSAIYSWDTNSLQDIVNTDIVVTWAEAVTGCAIGVLSVGNIGALSSFSAETTTGTGNLVLDTLRTTSAKPLWPCAIIGASCVTSGELFQIVNTEKGMDVDILYSRSNAEFSYAAAWSYGNQFSDSGSEIYVWHGTVAWSGTGSGDAVVWALS